MQGCLDLERDGAIARNLDQIYTYLVLRLQRINLENEVELCAQVEARLSELRASWAQIAEGRGAHRAPELPEAATISGLTLTI